MKGGKEKESVAMEQFQAKFVTLLRNIRHQSLVNHMSIYHVILCGTRTILSTIPTQLLRVAAMKGQSQKLKRSLPSEYEEDAYSGDDSSHMTDSDSAEDQPGSAAQWVDEDELDGSAPDSDSEEYESADEETTKKVRRSFSPTCRA
jgi:hypothetical protein